MTGDTKKNPHTKFPRHATILIWKSYLQRQRRWRWWFAETLFAFIVFTLAVLIAKPVFLTPLRDEPEPPLTMTDILSSLNKDNIIGYAPDIDPYNKIMVRAANLLNIGIDYRIPNDDKNRNIFYCTDKELSIIEKSKIKFETPDIPGAASELDLNNLLYQLAQGSAPPLNNSVIWIIWKPNVNNKWEVSIRSTERARYETTREHSAYPNPHLRAGFLAVQVAVSHAILEHYRPEQPKNYELNLVSMPVSPLMQEANVRAALSGIMLCFTLSLIPPVLETEALVVYETLNKFKRGLRMRGVGYSSMYIGWLVYAYFTALPISFLAAVTMILIFRWIHLMFALMIVLAYVTVMIIMALIMAMFHSKAWVACVWSTLFTLIQAYLAELLVHYEYGITHGLLALFIQIFLPPIGLVHAFNQFALLETGRGGGTNVASYTLIYAIVSWSTVIIIYFSLLMLLQRTIGQERAIGGQVSWKSIIFKQAEDLNKLRHIEPPTGEERRNLQDVSETVAKAISFRNVSKSIMEVPVLTNVTMDIYRGEFSMLFTERVQERMIVTLDDLLTGLTLPDKGSIYVLGHKMTAARCFIAEPHMVGYCHRADFLLPDLTVVEHLTLFTEICLWQETTQFLTEYRQIRCKRLLKECHLVEVQHVKVCELGSFFCAQLCWAIAVLLEPRIIVIPKFTEQTHTYINVIRDKIMSYKKYLTLVKLSFSTIQLEFADRVFVFDTRVLAFGGTPSYMFFKYGRDYNLRVTVRGEAADEQRTAALLARVASAGGSVRAHLGYLIVLRVPCAPTATVADLVSDIYNNQPQYGVTSMHVSVADTEEVYRRVIYESRAIIYHNATSLSYKGTRTALKRYVEPVTWTRKVTRLGEFTHLRNIGWKYFSFHLHYRLYFIITILSTFTAGIFLGLSMSSMLMETDRDDLAKKLLHGELLTLENLDQKTNLVLRSDYSVNATAMAHAYILSEPGATEQNTAHVTYTALSHTESLTEYLVTRAIDSPQLYVYLYAYGMDVMIKKDNTLMVNALYSPLHFDYAAAARSIAKVYSTLLRHYTGLFNSTIQISDDPLALDLTPWMNYAMKPPLPVQLLLILSFVHITLIPSMEHGLIRHMQSHALNFSPMQYWLTLFFCDIILYWIQVLLMSSVMVLMMYFVAPAAHFQYGDLLVVPFMLIVYGFALIPQAYLFSLGPRVTLNSMTFAIVCIVFGETAVVTKIFSGFVLKAAQILLSVSPQFNFMFAATKMKTIFLYNSECVMFKSQNLCPSRAFHKCCKKCGILQRCFVRKKYLTSENGIRSEMIAMCCMSVMFTSVLILLEYKTLQTAWRKLLSKLVHTEKTTTDILRQGTLQEKYDVLHKLHQIKNKRKDILVDTFGEHLLAHNITCKISGEYTVRNVYLGLGKGEALGLTGIYKQARLSLMETLAGYTLPYHGEAWCMSKWRFTSSPHKYARQISLSCELDPMPPWMSVYDGLRLLGLLRGVPRSHVDIELKNILEALAIRKLSSTLICRVKLRTDRTRLHFAAAIIGAPPIIMADECTAYQKFSVRRAMYCILHTLRKRGHTVIVSSTNLDSHMPLTNKLGIIVDGTIYDVDTVDRLGDRYGIKGYTVVIHVKEKVDVHRIFRQHFTEFTVNDTSETLANVQILDSELNWSTIFQKMEDLKNMNPKVDSYIVTVTPVEYTLRHSIIHNEKGNKFVDGIIPKVRRKMTKLQPARHVVEDLIPFEIKFDIRRLKELPWSVIFQTEYVEAPRSDDE